MATVTEASLKQDALELLSNVMQVGEHDYGQDQLDTALDVLGILRDQDDGASAAIEISAEDAAAIMAAGRADGSSETSSSGSVKTDFIPRMSDYEAQGDTAPAEGMTQQDTVELLTALAVRLHRFADECSRRAADGSPNESAHDTGRSDAYRDSWGRVLHVLRRIADAGKLVSTTDGIDFDEVTDAVTRPSDAERDAEQDDD